MPIRLARNSAIGKNKLILLFLQTRNRRNWKQESKRTGGSDPNCFCVPCEQGRCCPTKLSGWPRTLPHYCISSVLTVPFPTQLCGCDLEPDLLTCSSFLYLWKDVNTALLATHTSPISCGRRDLMAIINSHLSGLKISRWPWDLQDREAFWQHWECCPGSSWLLWGGEGSIVTWMSAFTSKVTSTSL